MSDDGAISDGSNTRLLGEVNKHLVLNAVRRHDAVSVEHLVRETGRSQPTVLKWLNELEREGFLRRRGRGRSTGGRRPVLYGFDAESGYLLGLALEIPDARLALVDLRGREVATREWQLDPHGTPEALLCDILDRTHAFVEEQAECHRETIGVGIALSGFVDRQAGLSLATPRLAGWHDVPVRDAVAGRLGLPVSLHHHIDALTLSETCFGAAADWSDFLYFDVGYGLGVRAVRRGAHVHGQFGNAGLIGHTTVVPDGRLCLCGNRGCLEEYVSGRALMRDRPPPPTSRSRGSPEDIDDLAQRLFDAARERNGPAQDAVQEIGRYSAIGIANAVNLFDVPRVVLSGFMRMGGDDLRRELLDAVRGRLQTTLAQHTRIRFSDVPRSRAGGHGAALFALRARLPFADPLVAPGDDFGEEVRPRTRSNDAYSRSVSS